MSGTIVFDHGAGWSASSGLFNWVVDFLANEVEDHRTSDQLRLIERENFRWLNLSDVTDEGRRQVLEVLRNRVVPYSEKELPQTPHRQEAIEAIRELSELAKSKSNTS